MLRFFYQGYQTRTKYANTIMNYYGRNKGERCPCCNLKYGKGVMDLTYLIIWADMLCW